MAATQWRQNPNAIFAKIEKRTEIGINNLSLVHTASFWNIIIQWTSHYDLTEKLISVVSLAKLVKWQKCKSELSDLTEKLLVSYFIG